MVDPSSVQAKRYERIVKLATEGIWTVDEKGLTDFINEQGAAILGYRPEEMLGRPLSDFVYPEDRAMLESVPEKIRQGESGRFEVRMPRKDGSEAWLLVSTSPMIGEDGRFRGALSMATDITERKRMEERLKESEERYRLLIQYAPTGIFEVDFSGPRFTSVNDVMSRATGYSRDELLAMNPLDLLDDESKLKFEERMRKTIRGEEVDSTVDYTVIGKDGRRIDVTLNTMIIYRDGRPAGAFVVVHDITERKRYEEDIKRSNEELEQFAYVASHDLQEPLRMVTMYLGLLTRKFGEDLPPQAKEYVSTAVEGSLRMKELIDDLLEFSRIGSRITEPDEVDMNQVMEEVKHDLHVAIAERNAEVAVSELPVVRADGPQMKQLMTNLISNAIKFHRDDERPLVTVSARRAGGVHVFSVRDNGIGIDPKYREKLFKMFQRLHTRDEYPGTGIGLAISKKIVERHGGKIWFESELGKGTTFHFTIPARAG